jgi:hypothetical protein
MYKVLNSDMKSPYRGFETEVGVEYSCPDFDDSDKECSRGFYATEPEGIVYSYQKGRRVFEVEVWGREKRFNLYKHRFENQKLLREVPEAELREILEKESQKVGYNVLEACFPINPLTDIQRDSEKVSDEEIELLKKWTFVWNSVGDSVGDSVLVSVMDSVWKSVCNSVGNSVWASVWSSVRDSVSISVGNPVWASVWASVRASVWAYISSFFPNVKKWKYVEHPDRSPDRSPDRIPNRNTDRIPDGRPDRCPDRIPNRITDRFPDRIHDRNQD